MGQTSIWRRQWALVHALLAVLVFLTTNTPTLTQAIIGGLPANLEDYPWMVVLLRKKYFRPPGQPPKPQDFYLLTQECGGSIIAADVVLTAQHCVPSTTVEVEYLIAAGLTSIEGIQVNSPNLFKVRSVIRYPRFFDQTYGKDVALLFLDRPLTFGPTVSAITMATPADKKWERVGYGAWIAGWGENEPRGAYSRSLFAGQVTITTSAALRTQVGALTPDQITAKSNGGKRIRDICTGDAGGSLHTLKGKAKLLVGVASWNVECGSSKYPSAYARVSQYSTWIKRILDSTNRPYHRIVLPIRGRTLILNEQVQQYKVVIPRNLRAVHFQLNGTGNVELGVRFMLKAGLPDCTAGPEWRCSFLFPMEGVYTVILTGLPENGGYVFLDAIFEVFDGETETVTQFIPNINLARASLDFWSGFPVLPNTTFSFVVKNKPLKGAVQPAGVISVNRVNVGNGIDENTGNLCPTGVVTCTTTIPRGATAVSMQIDGDKDFETLYDLEVTYTRIKGNYALATHPQIILADTEARRTFYYRNLPVGSEFGLRVHLHSGMLPLDVSIYFHSTNQMVQANDQALVGQTMFLSVVVPQWSTTAIVVFLGIGARFSFETLIERTVVNRKGL